MDNLCVIPARGGSKRIPRKNIKNFLGKPIIAYSIDAALSSGLFAEVMVSTDDEEIAEIAMRCGAKVPFLRSAENSSDYATTLDVLKEVISYYNKQQVSFQNVACIYPCAPFVTAKNLQDSFEIKNRKGFHTVFPVIEYSFPIQRSLTLNGGRIKFAYPEFSQTRSQDLEKHYHDAGQYYVLDVYETILKNRLLTENSGAVVISELEGQDIDNETDWRLAELKYQILTDEIS